jgi:hypothetical protein
MIARPLAAPIGNRRLVRVLPSPGASNAIGVSLDWMIGAPMTWQTISSAGAQRLFAIGRARVLSSGERVVQGRYLV